MKNCSPLLFYIILMIYMPLLARGQYQQASHKLTISVSEVELWKLVPEEPDDISYHVPANGEAGDPIQFSKHLAGKRIWINSASIIKDNNYRRKADITLQDEIPSGFSFLV